MNIGKIQVWYCNRIFAKENSRGCKHHNHLVQDFVQPYVTANPEKLIVNQAQLQDLHLTLIICVLKHLSSQVILVKRFLLTEIKVTQRISKSLGIFAWNQSPIQLMNAKKMVSPLNYYFFYALLLMLSAASPCLAFKIKPKHCTQEKQTSPISDVHVFHAEKILLVTTSYKQVLKTRSGIQKLLDNRKYSVQGLKWNI